MIQLQIYSNFVLSAVRTESINLDSNMLNQTENIEYEKWLFPLKSQDKTKSDLKKANSYEFINYDKGLFKIKLNNF